AGGSLTMMGPEQLLNFSNVGPAADIYSGGATIFRMLTGSTPLVLPCPPDRAQVTQAAGAILDKRRTPLAQLRPDVPTPIAELVDKLVARSTAAREHLQAHEIAETFQSWVAKLAPESEREVPSRA